MKVEKSVLLEKKRPLLKRLLSILTDSYEYVSILACDTVGKGYSISKSGIVVQEQQLFTDKGYVVKVYDGESYGEYSFNNITENNIDEIKEAQKFNPSLMVLNCGFDKLKEAIEECNLKLEGFLVNVVAGEKVLLQGKKGMNTKVLVDIGAETTDIVIFSNGVLKQIINKPVGGNNITKDLSICAEMSMDEADNLKKIYSKNYLKLNHIVISIKYKTLVQF